MSESDNSRIITSREIAKLFGLTQRRVQQLTNEGVIAATKVGNTNRYDLISTIHRYIAYLQKKAEENEEDPEVTELDIQKLKAEIKMKKAKARIAALRLKEMESKMHRSEDVKAMTTQLIEAIQTKILGLPDILAGDIAKLGTAAEVSTRIREAVCKILEDLSEYRYEPNDNQE